jgi:hypothetical protein
MGLQIQPDADIDLGRPVIEWTSTINFARGDRKEYLNVRIFEGKREDFNDVEINEAPKKKKEEKMDPRLALRMARIGSG